MATQYTAGITNGQVWSADIANTIGAAWENYTPVVKQGANTLTATVNYARWARIQKTVWVQIAVTLTQAGPGNQAITVSYPTGLDPITQANIRTIGTFNIRKPGVAFYTGVATVFNNVIYGQAYGGTDNMGANTPALTLAINDQIGIEVCYEVA